MIDDVLDLIGVKGERRKYIVKHGLDSPMNYFDGIHWNDEESEKVYKICNEAGITWEEYYGINKDERVIL